MKKKITVILAALLCIVMLFALTACAQNGFLSKGQAKRLYDTYGRPQAEMTLQYKKGSTNIEVKVVYDLLMDKVPVTVVNFINLTNAGFYNNTVIDSNVTSSDYVIFGRYKHEEEKYYKNVSDLKIVGEFASNNYNEPAGGYSEFSMFSLAMWHGAEVKNFDNANGTVILATDIPNLSSRNYAVFAEVSAVSVKYDDGEPTNYTGVPGMITDHFSKFSGTTERTVYDSAESDVSSKINLLSTEILVSIKMIGDTDWSQLPKVNG